MCVYVCVCICACVCVCVRGCTCACVRVLHWSKTKCWMGVKAAAAGASHPSPRTPPCPPRLKPASIRRGSIHPPVHLLHGGDPLLSSPHPSKLRCRWKLTGIRETLHPPPGAGARPDPVSVCSVRYDVRRRTRKEREEVERRTNTQLPLPLSPSLSLSGLQPSSLPSAHL